MKKLTLISAVLACALCTAPALAQDLPPIAVYVTGDVPDNEKKAFGTIMLSTLVNSGKYRGIERSESFLAEVDKEHVKQRSGAIDDSQISALGKQFGVKYICVADITKAFRAYHVSARIIDVETAEVPFIGETSSPLKTMDDLKDASDKVVESMFGGGIVPRRKKTGMSIGVGGLLSTDFGGGIKWNSSGGMVEMPYYGGGAYLFLDYKYAQVSVAYSTGGGKWDSPNVHPDSLFDMSRSSVSIGVFGKYPFAFGEFGNIRLYPLLGADYELSIAGQLLRSNGSKYVFGSGDKRHEQAGDLSALWFKFGGGADFDVSDAIYLRGELLYGIRTANKFENDGVKESTDPGTSTETRLGHGLTFRVGAGMKF